MSTPVEIADHVTRRRRFTYLTLAVLLLLLGMGAGWYLGRPSAQPPAQSEPEPEPEGGLQDGEFVPMEGEQEVDERYPVGFAHTAEGAVSAAFHSVKAQSTNDAEALVRVMETYRSPTQEGLDEEYVESMFLADRALEMSLRAPEDYDFDREAFPAPSSYHYIAPIGLHWQVESRTEVQVCLLVEIDASDGDGLVYRERDLLCQVMRWSDEQRGGDWVVEQVEQPSVSHRPSPEEYELDHEAWTPVAEAAGQGG